MTVFVASLFLPYTVHFGPSDNIAASPEDLRRPENTESTSAPTSYFSLVHAVTAPANLTTTIPLTPGATTDIERIFRPDIPRTPAAVSFARPESHAPVWGHEANSIQPLSRATAPPPASILGHGGPQSTSSESGGVVPSHSRNSPWSQQMFPHTNFTIDLGRLGNGGLVSALDAASDNGILEDKTWVGTLGMPTDALSTRVRLNISERLEVDWSSLAVWVEDSDFNGHYEHFCKTILWPVLHYQIPDHPKSKAYEDHSWVFYVKVNQAFADCLVKNWRRGDTIWVHDYHLLLVPAMVRKQLPDAPIGVYLHTAFPSSEIFRCLAPRAELLEGILGANMIGFQIEEYAHHFLQTTSRLLNVEATKQGIILEDGRFVHVDTFPIGVDRASIDARRQHPDVMEWADVISEKYAGKKLIVARDKLDSVRGVKHKLIAYERFLNTKPEYKGKVVLIQIATSTTEDPNLTSSIADIVTRINSLHSTLAHQPLVFLKQDIDYSQWLALLTIADGLLVTSLREGMNLTGHEFIHCQDGIFGKKKHSPLIVSEFTGAASILKDGALLVNPWNFKQCADALEEALEMLSTERESRWNAMLTAIARYDAMNWVETYKKGLEHAFKDHSLRDATSVPRLSIAPVIRRYNSASKRLLILDYEGTLAAWGSPTETILTTPKKATDVLNDLIDDKKNIVYVMSSRRPDEMESLFKQVPGVGMIAESGAYLLEAGSNEWIALIDPEHVSMWKVGVRRILQYYEERIEKSKIEELESAMILNYAATQDKSAAFKQAGECANHINDACHSQKVNALPIDNGLYISDAEVNKATAAKYIGDAMLKLSSDKNVPLPEFLLVIGDSREDEHVFEWAQKMEKQGIRDVITVTVGQRNTMASCTLTQGVTGVISTLQKLAGTQAVKALSSPNASKRSE